MTNRKTETKRDAAPIMRNDDPGQRETRSYSPRRTPLTNNPPPRSEPKPADEK